MNRIAAALALGLLAGCGHPGLTPAQQRVYDRCEKATIIDAQKLRWLSGEPFMDPAQIDKLEAVCMRYARDT